MSAGAVASAPARDEPSAADAAAASGATECGHCELPLGRRHVAGVVEGERYRFCCYGCLLAMQVTRARGESGAASALLIRLGLAVFFAMNVMTVSLPTYALHLYGGNALAADGALFRVLRVLSLAFAAPVLALLGWPILASAARSARLGGAGMDGLIVLGTAAAFGLSVANTLRGAGAVYFDTVAMLLVFVTIGRYLEARAKADASAGVRATLAPVPAAAERLNGGEYESVAPDALRPGDVVRVGPGGAFPTDGMIVDGIGDVDESALTGRSVPSAKHPGSAVASGSCSVDGVFAVRVTARAADSAAARLARLLSDARRQRAVAERVADSAASVLVPAVVALALGSAVFWTARAGLDQGLLTGLAVLVVACPCGLGLATPVAMWTALAAATRRGVILRSGGALERVALLRQVLFDKTGTLTERAPRLAAVEPAGPEPLPPGRLLAIAAALEEHLTHPLARTLVASARSAAGAAPRVSDVTVLPGRGVRGVVDGAAMAIGSARFAREELGDAALPPLEREGDTSAVHLWTRERLLATFRFAEVARPGAREAVTALRRLGLQVGVLSGDDCAAAVVPHLVAAHEAALALLPEEKVARVRRAGAGTAFVGDGINDAPAVAAADVGFAVASATDLTRVTADVAVVSDDLRQVPWLIALARRARRIMHQNLWWVVAYNLGALAVAAAGRLDPLVASLAMLGSSVLVVANARRLRHD